MKSILVSLSVNRNIDGSKNVEIVLRTINVKATLEFTGDKATKVAGMTKVEIEERFGFDEDNI